MNPKYTIEFPCSFDLLKTANARNGGHYFDDATRKGFQSRLIVPPNEYGIILESVKYGNDRIYKAVAFDKHARRIGEIKAPSLYYGRKVVNKYNLGAIDFKRQSALFWAVVSEFPGQNDSLIRSYEKEYRRYIRETSLHNVSKSQGLAIQAKYNVGGLGYYVKFTLLQNFKPVCRVVWAHGEPILTEPDKIKITPLNMGAIRLILKNVLSANHVTEQPPKTRK